MEQPMDFGTLLSGLQRMAERDKIIFEALMDRLLRVKPIEAAKIERLLGRMAIAAIRQNAAARPDAGVRATARMVLVQAEDREKGVEVTSDSALDELPYPSDRITLRSVFEPLLKRLSPYSLYHPTGIRHV